MSRGAAPPLSPEEFEALLKTRASELGLEKFPLTGLGVYLSELDRWRRRVNLTGKLTARQLTEHALEALLPLDLIAHGERVVDIGSGAGFPGLPIALARPDLEVSLVEPRAKRTAFLRHVARSLKLSRVRVLESRIEEVGGQTFGCATTRAVGGFAKWLGNAAFIEPGGLLMAWTTDPEGVGTQLPGFRLERVLPVAGSARRAVAVYRKHA